MNANLITLRHVLVRLISQPVYHEDKDLWTRLLRERTAVEQYFQQIGLELVLDEEGGYAFLRQGDDNDADDAESDDADPTAADSAPDGHAAPLPRLLRRSPLGFLPTVLMLELRERMLRHDESADGSVHLYLDAAAITDFMAPYCGEGGNEQKTERQIQAAIRRLMDLAVLRQMPNRGDTIYRVEPILRAKLPIDKIEEIRARLRNHIRDGETDTTEEQDDHGAPAQSEQASTISNPEDR